MSAQEQQSSHSVKCAEPGCTTWFIVTRENAFQRYCSEHRAHRKTARAAYKLKTPNQGYHLSEQ